MAQVESTNQVQVSEVRGRSKGDIAFSTARKLIDADVLSYEEVCEALDTHNVVRIHDAVKELAKKNASDTGTHARGGRRITDETLAALGEMKLTEEQVNAMDPKDKAKALTAARGIAKARKFQAALASQTNDTAVDSKH